MKNKRESPASDGPSAQPRFHQRAAEIQAYGTVNHLLPVELEETVRLEMTAQLNQLLADTMTLRDLYKQSHWQVSRDKYRIGEWLNVTDPASGKHAVKNLFYKSIGRLKKGSKDLDDSNSIYQNTSMQAPQARGVQFLSCHTALKEQVRVLIRAIS